MKKPVAALAACLVVVLGIVVGRTDADGIATPDAAFLPPAAPNPSRIQWEYKELQKTAGEITVQEFDQLGADGWEMCGVRQRGQGVCYFYFKRERLPQGQHGVVGGDLPTFVPGMESVKRNEPAATYQRIPDATPTPAAPSVSLPPPPTDLPSTFTPVAPQADTPAEPETKKPETRRESVKKKTPPPSFN